MTVWLKKAEKRSGLREVFYNLISPNLICIRGVHFDQDTVVHSRRIFLTILPLKKKNSMSINIWVKLQNVQAVELYRDT